MDVTDLISHLQTHLDQQLAPDVLVSGSDERPVPGVVIEDWNITHLDGSMNNYLTSIYDDQGNETARVYRLPYECRVSIMVRDNGEVQSSRLHDSLKRELFKIQARPAILSDGISHAEVNGGGGVSHQFVNPSESEFNQTVTFGSSLVQEISDYDTIEEITTEIIAEI